jgi:diaminohydroxyphosphoribosylaminopyrimidine deaminase/5-amino-6-(5-phosphoribosylamino)uracil reductase
MTRAAELGRSARRRASPNPGVGCVIATASGAVFEGATAPPGGDHAEIAALHAALAAGADTAGATAWVTLEPCSHHGRTGPCADALLAAGVGRVVVALEDPDPHVTGAGLAKLRGAGVDVELGVNADEVAHDLEAYLIHRRLGRPFVTLKLGTTTDGRTVSDDPSTQWITGPEARADGHRLRAENDAILVGAGTVRTDNPRLTTRDADGPDPVRVVLGVAPSDAAIQPCVEKTGALEDVLRELAADGVTSLLVEGGATVAQEFHDAGLVDRYVMYVANTDPDTAAAAMRERWQTHVVDATAIGNDVRVILEPSGRR